MREITFPNAPVSANLAAKFFRYVAGARARARARNQRREEPNNTGGRYTWSFRFPLIDACRLPVRSQPLRSVPPGVECSRAGLRRGAPPRRKRSITRPRDHVTVWPLFHAIISLSICPNDARPIRPPPPYLLLSRRPRPPPLSRMYTYIYICALSTCTMHPLSSTRVYYISPLCTWTRAYCTYTHTHACVHARIYAKRAPNFVREDHAR